MSGWNWSNWSGAVKCSPQKLETAGSIEDVAKVVKDCAARGVNLRVVGSGHSFTELVATNGVILSLDGLSGLESVDRDRKEATVLAGTKLWALNELLEQNGLAMENLGDINRQSIAGAVSTGTHGTGIGWRNISSQSCALTLVTADGEILECSEDQDRDLFKAAQVSLGSLGVIVKVRLRLVPSYRLRYEKKRVSFDECGEKLKEYREGNRHFEFYWFPHTEAVQLKFLNQTDAPPDNRKVSKFINDVILENGAFGLISHACRIFPSFCESACKLCGKLLSEGVEVNQSHRVFSTSRMVHFNEMEYGLHADRGFEALREIKQWIADKKIAVNFPVEFRFVKGDDIPISPSHGRDTAYIAVHMFRGMEYKKYFEGVEAIFKNYEGRPHWGKMHTRTASDLAKLYPQWEKFQTIRRRLDPHGVFLTPYLRRLFEA